MIFRILWAAFSAFVPLVAAVNLAVALAPRARGIAFVSALRYAVTVPLCAASALGAVILYAWLDDRIERPRWTLAATLLALALVGLALMGLLGPRGLARAAAPAMAVGAATMALLVPRFLAEPPRLVGAIAVALLGALELVGFAAALSHETHAPAGSSGVVFDVPRELFDVDHHFVDLPSGARVHYVDEGKGPTLLFLHGNPAWSFQWRALVVGLRGRFRCVALDYPGFGQSSAPDGYGFTPREQSRVVEELVDHLGLREVTLVMQDWGGPIGLGLAGRRPELVRSVVLGNTWAWPTSTSEPRGKFSVIVGGPIGEFAQINFNGFASFGLRHGVLRELPDEVVAMYLRPFQPLDRRGIAAFYPGQITAASAYLAEVEAGLGRLGDRRALIFWGLRDAGFPRRDLERFEETFPRHETVELDADHFFFEDAAERMIPRIEAFLHEGPS
jgi:pimeloyl-ACP methyl ester carboxylesterase/chromate transport protein ChrA